jgi:hypothetical protein
MDGRFGDFAREMSAWITVFDSPYYPDTLDAAITTYAPVIEEFAELCLKSSDSADLFRRIQNLPSETRVQVLRVFRRYVSPDTSVEMLRRKRSSEQVIADWGTRFRPLPEVLERIAGRPTPDEAVIALLADHSTRGQKGYALTEAFFLWFESEFTDAGWSITGPSSAGRDVDLPDVIPGYPHTTPADFILRDPVEEVRVVGFARYDTDRGGSQEDDRIGGNERRLREILSYAEGNAKDLKVLFLNDGPGLTLGSMWRDNAAVEDGSGGRALVTTLKMAQAGRISTDWLES